MCRCSQVRLRGTNVLMEWPTGGLHILGGFPVTEFHMSVQVLLRIWDCFKFKGTSFCQSSNWTCTEIDYQIDSPCTNCLYLIFQDKLFVQAHSQVFNEITLTLTILFDTLHDKILFGTYFIIILHWREFFL